MLLEEEIDRLREILNSQIENDEKFEEVLKTSRRLDELLNGYYIEFKKFEKL